MSTERLDSINEDDKAATVTTVQPGDVEMNLTELPSNEGNADEEERQKLTVETSQPTSALQFPRIPNHSGAYTYKMTSCTNDVKFCLLSGFCHPIAAAVVSAKIKENPCYGPFCGVLPLNVKYRMMAGIHQPMCHEGLQATCCGPCFLCRLHNELQHHEF